MTEKILTITFFLLAALLSATASFLAFGLAPALYTAGGFFLLAIAMQWITNLFMIRYGFEERAEEVDP